MYSQGKSNYKRKNYTNNRSYRRKPPRRFSSFDPRHVIKNMAKASPEENKYQIRHQFSEFGLEPQITTNIQKKGFTQPTPIQDQAIPIILQNQDLVGIANTGTGKTAAFLIPLIQKIYHHPSERILILTPTRELASQIDKELQGFTKGLRIYSATCIGGMSIHKQIEKLKRKPQFVIGTPGRLIDLANRKKIYFSNFSTVVLDEVDQMLDMGFIPDMKKIIEQIPEKRQSLFFSATLSEKSQKIMNQFTKNPQIIKIASSPLRKNIQQEIVEINNRPKTEILCELLIKDEISKTLIFVRTKRRVNELQKNLAQTGFQVGVLHGDRTQKQRRTALTKFRQGEINILIATDVASRGLDIQDISHVINYDLPENYDTYIHRIGRTGRVDKKGIALSFI